MFSIFSSSIISVNLLLNQKTPGTIAGAIGAKRNVKTDQLRPVPRDKCI